MQIVKRIVKARVPVFYVILACLVFSLIFAITTGQVPIPLGKGPPPLGPERPPLPFPQPQSPQSPLVPQEPNPQALSAAATTASVAVTPSGTLTMDPSQIKEGESATLSWTSLNATSATINGEIVTLNGSMVLSPAVGHYEYTLALIGPYGTATGTIFLDVLIAYDTSHDPGDLHGVPDFAFNATRFTTVGAGPDDVVRIGHTNSEDICEPTICKVLGIHGKVKICGELRVKELIVYHDGELVLASGARVIIRDLPFDENADPEQWGDCVGIFGKLRCSPASQRTKYVRVEDVHANQTALTIHGAAPENWKVGDEIVIPRSRPNHPQFKDAPFSSNNERRQARFYAQTERATISGIDASTITLAALTKWDHPGGVDRNGAQISWVPVANLMRDIVIESENPQGIRGHFFATMHADVLLDGVEFRGLSRTTIYDLNSIVKDSQGNYALQFSDKPRNQIGRYATHFHHLIGPMGGVDGTPYQVVMRNCVIDNGDGLLPFKWNLALHRCSWALIEDNVFYSCAGGNVAEEDGCERDNVYRNNVILTSNSRTLFKDASGKFLLPENEVPGANIGGGTDIRGTAAGSFWFCNIHNVVCEGNITGDVNIGTSDNWNPDGAGSTYWNAAGRIYGFMPTQRGQDPSLWVAMGNTPPAEERIKITNAEAFGGTSRGSVGFTIASGAFQSGKSVVLQRSKVWNSRAGFTDYWWVNALVEDFEVYGCPDLMLIGGGDVIHASRCTNLTYRRIRGDNCDIGYQIRVGRGGKNVFAEDLDFACANALLFTANEGVPDFYCLVRNLRISPSTVLYRGWTATNPPKPSQNPNDLTFTTLQGLLFRPDTFTLHTIRLENWTDEKNYRVFADFQRPDFVIPTASQVVAYRGLTNQQIWDQYGKASYGIMVPADAIQIPKTNGAWFKEE